MANLIITVISIALVAVAAVMGAYYGGSAFMEGQSKARNNGVINVIQQTEVAYNLCMAQEPNARNADGPCETYDGGGGTLISKGYLTSDPTLQICNDGKFGCEDKVAGYNGGTAVSSAPGFYFNLVGSSDTSDTVLAKMDFELCKFIAKKGGGDNAMPRLSNTSFPFLPASGEVYKMDCTYQDKDGDNTPTVADYFNVSYKF